MRMPVDPGINRCACEIAFLSVVRILIAFPCFFASAHTTASILSHTHTHIRTSRSWAPKDATHRHPHGSTHLQRQRALAIGILLQLFMMFREGEAFFPLSKGDSTRAKLICLRRATPTVSEHCSLSWATTTIAITATGASKQKYEIQQT